MSQAPVTMTVYVQDDHSCKVAINEKIFGIGKSWHEAFQAMINLVGFDGVITEALVAHHVAETEKKHATGTAPVRAQESPRAPARHEKARLGAIPEHEHKHKKDDDA